jgi:hypothetical protein
MGSITYWNKVETRPVSHDIERAIAAEVRDPLWMLTRQWQVGEFESVNGGSPISVEIAAESFKLASGTAGTTPLSIVHPVPLEPQIQYDPVVPDLATRVELANMFLELIAPSPSPVVSRATMRNAYPLTAPVGSTLDSASESFFNYAKTRSFDGFRLFSDRVNGISLNVPGPSFAALVDNFVARVRAVFPHLAFSSSSQDPPGWNSASLRNEVDLVATNETGGNITLKTFPDAAGRLDWDAFDVTSANDGSGLPSLTIRKSYPIHLRYPGMPTPRFWNFEEGNLNLPRNQTQTYETSTLLFLDMAMIHGVDWFIADHGVETGTINRIHHVIVRDVFGVETIVKTSTNRPGESWSIFQNGSPDLPENARNFLMVPHASLSARQMGEPIEDVLFARDEMANIAWAIERRVATQIGRYWTGQERAARLAELAPPVSPQTGPINIDTPLRYDLMSEVPLHFVPLLPRQIVSGSREIEFVAGTVVGRDADESPSAKILKPSGVSPYVLHEEEIPREGVNVRRRFVRSRGFDGSNHLWVERHSGTGRGESQAGLRFDQALHNRT